MNIGNILKVADAIENASVPGLGFNMNCGIETTDDNWRGTVEDLTGRGCGTVACVAGWTAIVCGTTSVKSRMWWENIAVHARRKLGLTSDQGSELFEPNGYEDMGITPEHAVRCLRNLAITGKVDWKAAMKGDEPALPPVPVKTEAKEPV